MVIMNHHLVELVMNIQEHATVCAVNASHP